MVMSIVVVLLCGLMFAQTPPSAVFATTRQANDIDLIVGAYNHLSVSFGFLQNGIGAKNIGPTPT
jgi:hypothetical protein